MPLDDLTEHCVNACTLWYKRRRRLPTPVDIYKEHEDYYKDALQVAGIFNDQEFIVAMCRRGVPWVKKTNGLTTSQMLALQAVLNPSLGGTIKDKLKTVGVSYGQWSNWLKDRQFMSYFQTMGSDVLQESVPLMKVALARNAEKGDLNSIKFGLEITGEYNPAKENAIEVQAVLAQVIEVLAKHVHDPDTLGKIGFELSAIAGRAGVMGPALPEAIQGEVLDGYVHDSIRITEASADRPRLSFSGLERELGQD